MLSEPSESMKPGPLGRNTTVPSGQSAVHNFPFSVRVLYGTVAWTFVVLGVANRTANFLTGGWLWFGTVTAHPGEELCGVWLCADCSSGVKPIAAIAAASGSSNSRGACKFINALFGSPIAVARAGPQNRKSLGVSTFLWTMEKLISIWLSQLAWTGVCTRMAGAIGSESAVRP